MLQQTQVDRVLPKYLGWMGKWPTIQDLAKAQLAEVIIFWQGLGYNRRARFLWLLAKEIVEHRRGEWPRSEDELLKLPGIGKYTARAILSFAFGQHRAVVDTNVKRVVSRVTEGKEANVAPTLSEKGWFELADCLLPDGLADPWNQLLMDFGALICSAKAPKCETCPIQQYCQAQQTALQRGYPTYGALLNKQLQVKKATQKTTKESNKKTQRFKDTDRYFRGRIIDLLRQDSYPTQKLFKKMSNTYNLTDRPRLKRLLDDLSAEGLISKHHGRLKLG